MTAGALLAGPPPDVVVVAAVIFGAVFAVLCLTSPCSPGMTPGTSPRSVYTQPA